MEAIRDQQEILARLHFELGAQHDVKAQQTSDNMNELVSALEHLSQTIEQIYVHTLARAKGIQTSLAYGLAVQIQDHFQIWYYTFRILFYHSIKFTF
jgi:hypothetical protein